jgi:hypothetical protein
MEMIVRPGTAARDKKINLLKTVEFFKGGIVVEVV